MSIEAYPKAGEPNPVVDLFVYDVATKSTVKIDVRSGKPFDNDVVGHYVYRVSWSPDGKELLFTAREPAPEHHRVRRGRPRDRGVPGDRARGVADGVGRTDSLPTQVFLKDGRRFIWGSERTGWLNYYLYDLSGTLITPLTRYTTFEAASLVKIDEDAKVVFVHGA